VKGDTPRERFKSWAVPFLSGGIAGITAKTAVAPLERVKIMYQVNHSQYREHETVFRKLIAVMREEGAKGLFRGNGATVLRIFPYAAIQFMTYEQVLKLFKLPPRGAHKDANLKTTLISLAGGSAAGAVSVVFTYPLDLMRARMAVEHVNQGGLYSAFVRYLKKDGWRGLFRGMGPSLWGILPYAGINFSTYETLRALTATYYGDNSVPVPVKLICGGLAGAVGQTVAYPLDVVRRRMQTAGYSDGMRPIESKNTLRAMIDIVKHEGWKALFKGLSINYLKVVPAVSISFTTYEYMMALFNKSWPWN
jgi:hypothetical protein